MEDGDTRLFKTLQDCGLSIRIPINTVELGTENLKYPVLLPRDVVISIANKGFIQKVLGVPLGRAQKSFRDFWKKFQLAFPGHDLCKQGLSETDFETLIPYYLHGDGGRTFKKDSILICSMYPALGRGSTKCQVPDMQPGGKPHNTRKRKRTQEAPMAETDMGVNLLGNSLGNRFLFVAMHNNYVKQNKTVFYDLLELWAKEMAFLFTDGFRFEGHHFKIAVLGLTGDAPFLRDAGLMNRSFNNIRKSLHATSNLPGVCHLCAAGKTNGPHYENLDILNADWIATTASRNFLPWGEPSPLLAYLPAEQQNLANFFKGDLFHIWYAGLGKEFCASSLVFLLQTVMKQRNKESSMAFLNDEMRRLQSCRTVETMHFGRFSWDLLDYDGPHSYPKGKWSKGMDTANVTKLIETLVSEYLSEHSSGPHGQMLQLIYDGCSSIGEFLRSLFGSGFFLPQPDAYKAICAGHSFLLTYMKLAKTSLASNRSLFKLKPKAHAMAHIVFEMLVQYKRHPESVCNPVSFSTFMCEDFVGHVARLSRRVSPRVQGTKVIYRYLTALKQALSQEAS